MKLIEKEGVGDDILRWNGIKAMVDGSLGSRTAWMHNHYLDEKNSKGFLIPILSNIDRKSLCSLSKFIYPFIIFSKQKFNILGFPNI